MRRLQALSGAFVTLVLVRGVLLWLNGKGIYPEIWVAEMISGTESLLAEEAARWIIIGVAGLVGLFIGPFLWSRGMAMVDRLRPQTLLWLDDVVSAIVEEQFPIVSTMEIYNSAYQRLFDELQTAFVNGEIKGRRESVIDHARTYLERKSLVAYLSKKGKVPEVLLTPEKFAEYLDQKKNSDAYWGPNPVGVWDPRNGDK